MPRRIFIAINLPTNIKKELSSFQKRWPDLPCRWVKKENLHLTLAFLGHLNEEQLNQVLEAIKQATDKNESFVISLNKVIYGPPGMKPPRLIWIEGEKSEELADLKKDLDELLREKINFQDEQRDFRPHITLARIKKWDWQRIEPEERPEINFQVSFEIPVNSIEIMESQLGRGGAKYKILNGARLKIP